MEQEKYKNVPTPRIRDMNRKIDRDNRNRQLPKNFNLPRPTINKQPEKSSTLDDLFDKVEEPLPRKEELSAITKEDNESVKYNQATIIPTDQWKQTFRKTDSIELAGLIQNSTVSHNALLRLTGSYSTKMLSNIKLNNRELSGIETRPTKVFYNQQADIREATTTNILSYIPYIFNYLSMLEKDTTKQTYIDNLYILNEKLYFSLYLYKNAVIETECLVLTKENKITENFRIQDSRNSLKIFITEEKNNEEMLSTIQQELNQIFLLIVLDRNNNELSLQIYNREGKVPFSIGNLKKLNKEKITILEDDKQHELIKAKYSRGK